MREGKSRGWLILFVTALAACSSGGGSPRSQAGSPSGTSIGTAGGTVSGPSGAKVVIPAGALSTPTVIAITQTSTGAPPLPAGVVPFGPMFAFTPHGTTFAVPVTLSVPFDSTQVPAGTQPVLYKTNPAMTGWAEVTSATASGGTLSGAVTSFSFVVAGPPPPPPLEKGTPHKSWTVQDIRLNGTTVEQPHDSDDQDGGVLERNYDFGPGTMTDPGVQLDLLPREFRSTGRIFSSAGGGIYAVSAEAPIAKKAEQLAGNDSDYSQSQSYVKRDAGAKLRLEITQARIEAFDDSDPLPLPCNAAQADAGFPKCGGEMLASVDFRVKAHSKNRPNLFRGKGALMLNGWRGHWLDHVNIGLLGRVPLWGESDVDFLPDIDGDGKHARQSLKRPVFVNIDLSDVAVGEEFTVDVDVVAYVFDGRSHAEFSYLGAFFRDPTRIDGDPKLIAEGLDPTDNPEPPPPPDDPSLPAECLTQAPAGQLDFLSPTYTALEGGAGVDLLVLRTDGRAGAVSTTVTTGDGTATAPDDYQSVQTVVTFPDGDTTPRFVHVPLVYSSAAEGDKTFAVTLGQPTGCATLGQATTVVTILDDTRSPLPTETFALGGTVSGLVGTGLVLSELFSEQTVSPPTDGPFSFADRILDQSPYDVRIQSQPDNPPQACSLDHGAGTFAGADVTNITVTCAPPTSSDGLDHSFGTGGRAVTPVPFFAGLLGARVGMALQGDGKILLVGGLKLLRLNTDGTMDGTFGTAGVVNVVFDNGPLDTAMDVVVQADGKIVVAGTGSTSTVVVGTDNFALTRFNSDGSLDTTFGTGGHVTTDFFGSTDEVRRMKLQPDGKILVVGFAVHPISAISGSVLFAIARYNADGTPDLGFAAGGKTTDSPGDSFSEANGLAIQSDGNIVVAGFTAASGGDADDTGFVRYLGDGQVHLPGTRDETFGPMGNGVLQASLGGDDEVVDVVILADGTILGAVRVNTGTGPGFGLEHVPPSGIPPPRFAQPVVSFTTQSDFPRAMLKQADGKIVVVGQSAGQAPNPDMAIARFNDSGLAPDTSFGTDGKLMVDFFGKIDSAEAVLQQADGKVVVGGFARNGSTTVFAAVRLAQ